jgi:hypothetical protein
MLSGSLGGAVISDARVRGDQVMFSAGGVRYTGTVSGNAIKGTAGGSGAWTATKK